MRAKRIDWDLITVLLHNIADAARGQRRAMSSSRSGQTRSASVSHATAHGVSLAALARAIRRESPQRLRSLTAPSVSSLSGTLEFLA